MTYLDLLVLAQEAARPAPRAVTPAITAPLLLLLLGVALVFYATLAVTAIVVSVRTRKFVMENLHPMASCSNPDCRAQNESTARFCRRCGGELARRSAPTGG